MRDCRCLARHVGQGLQGPATDSPASRHCDQHDDRHAEPQRAVQRAPFLLEGGQRRPDDDAKLGFPVGVGDGPYPDTRPRVFDRDRLGPEGNQIDRLRI